MATPETEALFYDIDKLNQIPILSAAGALGLSVQIQGSNHWCQRRSEDASLVYLDPALNAFYDFGTNIHGDVIRFVRHCTGFSPMEAVSFLAEHFDIVPTLTREEFYGRPLSNWEYKKIGLHGDMTTKNLGFPIDSNAVQMLYQLGDEQSMALSELQAKHPAFYKQLILTKALPFVAFLRNSYQRDILSFFYASFPPGERGLHAMHQEALLECFAKDTANLNRCERILYRAGLLAGLELPEPTRHDPVVLIQRMLQGDLTLTLGNCSFNQLSVLADRSGCRILETDIPADSYFNDRLSSIGHSAIFHGGNVLLQYLSSDEAEIMSSIGSLERLDDYNMPPVLRDGPSRPPEYSGNEKQK